MATGFFGDIKPVRYEGPDSTNPLAYRFYDKDEVVAGKRLEDHLRFSIAYWHSFAWPGGDPFGGQTFERPWFGDDMDKARGIAPAGDQHLAIGRRFILETHLVVGAAVETEVETPGRAIAQPQEIVHERGAMQVVAASAKGEFRVNPHREPP